MKTTLVSTCRVQFPEFQGATVLYAYNILFYNEKI